MPQTNRPLDATQARRRLGVAPGADAGELRRAFARAVKAAHPDRPGGDGERLREVIEAFRWLDAAVERTPEPPPSRAGYLTLTITIAEALSGGWARADVGGGRILSVRLPAGLRPRERVRVSGCTFEVAIAPEPGLQVAGDDLLAIVEVESATIREGGRAIVEAPTGPTSIWISKADGARGFVRLPGFGLPARGVRPTGDLVVRLKAAPDERFDTPVQAMRRRFAAAWAA